MDFQRRLRHHVNRVGISGSALAAKVGTSPSAVSRWLNGETPTFDNLVKVVAALDMSMEEFWAPFDAVEAAS